LLAVAVVVIMLAVVVELVDYEERLHKLLVVVIQ
jgi:hypothetical protein